MAPITSNLMSSGSKKKEPSYVCLSEAKASHSHKMWTEVSSSVPHFPQVGLLYSPIIYGCLLKVLCPVNRPITTLGCVLLKDNNWAPVARSGPEINSRACLCTTGTMPWFTVSDIWCIKNFRTVHDFLLVAQNSDRCSVSAHKMRGKLHCRGNMDFQIFRGCEFLEQSVSHDILFRDMVRATHCWLVLTMHTSVCYVDFL
jgi:hypothetical protein